MVRVSYAAAGIAALIFVSLPAQAETDAAAASCGAAYHEKLRAISTTRGDGLATVFGALRAADPALPGKWVFAYDAKLEKSGRVRTTPVTNDICVTYEGRGKRARCTNTEKRVLGSSEIAYAAVKDPADVQASRALQDFVTRRGAVPEVGDNGRLTWLVQKLAQDLKSYVSQPAHPAMCAGGREVSEFYGAQTTPLEKRRQDIGALLDGARLKARERAATFVTVMAQPSKDATGEAGPSKPAVVAPEAAAKVPDVPANARALLAVVLERVLPADQAGDVADESTVFAAMRRAKTFLLERQDATVPTAGAEDNGKAQSEALGRALVAIEMLAYAELLSARFDAVQQTILVTPSEIQSAHAAACGCAN